jgi:putative membrane protein
LESYTSGQVFYWLVFLLAVGAIAGLIFYNARLLRKKKKDRAIEILRERYAKGEVDEKTFLRMKAELEGKRIPPYSVQEKEQGKKIDYTE